MKFVKMHGAGNDYVYIDGFGDGFEQTLTDPQALAVQISDRHFGVGSDGLILILPSDCADARMRMFNADGSEAEMCGNGLRCVAKYIYDHGLAAKKQLQIETLAGVLTVDLIVDDDSGLVDQVRVDMGLPRLLRRQIPMTADAGGDLDGQALDIQLTVEDRDFQVSCLSMGNPHCVVFVDDVDNFAVDYWGPLIETHPLFPQRINVEFVEVLSMDEVKQRTWERGAGETLACGTGASAVCVAGFLSGRTERRISNQLRGGVLTLEYDPEGSVLMTGPATQVFVGDFPWQGN
ncbi:MAG: diaminopimelate epimerase [Desulfuromonas sp.]|nr:diaminopimelate epimerase [Desulfuromonas sp.]